MGLHSHSCVRNFQAWIRRGYGACIHWPPDISALQRAAVWCRCQWWREGSLEYPSACCDWFFRKRKNRQLHELVEDLITSYEKLGSSTASCHSRRTSSIHIWITFRVTMVLSVTNTVSICSRHLGDGEQMWTNRVLPCWPITGGRWRGMFRKFSTSDKRKGASFNWGQFTVVFCFHTSVQSHFF